jgi:hypothetical protein
LSGSTSSSNTSASTSSSSVNSAAISESMILLGGPPSILEPAAPSVLEPATGASDGAPSVGGACLALRRWLRLRVIVEPEAVAPAELLSAAAGGGGMAGCEGASLGVGAAVPVKPDAANAASIPDSRDPLPSSPATRGRR